MDQTTLVSRDADDLKQIARVFREEKVDVLGIYSIRLTADSGYTENVVRLVTERKFPNAQREMIHKLVRLRRDGKIPKLDRDVRFDIVQVDDPEASRVIDYARQYGSLPVVIHDAMWKGMFIEHAIVAEVPTQAPVPV